jgi:AcrR family transcriptional regulator
MPRPTIHTEEAILDAARQVVLERGVRATTVTAIAGLSGAPMGSIYHRFSSVDELLARLWIRAARRAQAAILDGLAGQRPDDIVQGALAVYDFCLREPEDALLLASFALTDFDHAALPADVETQLASLNDPISPVYCALAKALGGPAAHDVVHLLLVDLPFGAARRHIQARTTPPAERRALLSQAIKAIAHDHLAPASTERSAFPAS